MSRLENLHQSKVQTYKSALKITLNFLLKTVIAFIVLSVIGIIIVFHSPFTVLKELYVTTAMTTATHQYLAKWFVSEDEINKIMAKNNLNDTMENTNEGEINPQGSQGMELIKLKGPTYKGYMLIVNDPSRVVIGTGKLGKKGMKVEDIVKEYGAESGINAGGFPDSGGHGSGSTPDGILIENYKVLHTDKSSKYRLIGMDRQNVLVLGNYSLKEILSKDIRDAVSFRPFLIINGNPTIKSGNGGWGIGPRTAIGQKKDGTILMIVIDGRQVGSIGASLKEVQDIMLQYGAYNAASLDGGSSSTMIYQGKLINSPCSKYGPRYVPSAFIIKP
jgi:exopolysaccharide biosynthesis protein